MPSDMFGEEEMGRCCEAMHDAYEAAARKVGWETQARSRKPWAEVPESNKAAMRASVRVALSFAAELLAARGGTMTAEELKGPQNVEYLKHGIGPWMQRLGTHLAAKGARIAALEAECGNLARRLRDEEGEVALKQAALNGCDAKMREMDAELSKTRIALGETMIAHGLTAPPDYASTALHAVRDGLMDVQKAVVHLAFAIGEVLPKEGARYPCSPACIHDDAKTPGHPERVKTRSEAFTAVAEEG